PGVWGHRMAVMQPLRVDHERLVRGEYAKVGVETGCDPPLRGKSGELGRSPRHPDRDLAQGHTSASCLGPYDRQPELEGGDAAPCRAEVATVEVFHRRRARRVVRCDEVQYPGGEAAPEKLAVGRLAHWRRAFECGGPVADLLGRQGQVMGAGLRR